MPLTPRTAGAAGRTIQFLAEAISCTEGHILIPLKEEQMLGAANAVLNRAFDELMILFAHLDNKVLIEKEAKTNPPCTPVVVQGPQQPFVPHTYIPRENEQWRGGIVAQGNPVDIQGSFTGPGIRGTGGAAVTGTNVMTTNNQALALDGNEPTVVETPNPNALDPDTCPF